MVKQLVWSDFSADSAVADTALLVSERTQSLLLSAIEYIQKEYVWVGNFDEIDAALAEAIKEVLVEEEVSMACEDVADCVETEIVTNIELQNAIYNYNTSVGLSSNTTHVNASTTTILDRILEQELSEPIAELENCNLSELWGAIRSGIVLRLNDNARDMLEDLEPIADVEERLQVFIDIVPVIGDLLEGLALQITEIVPDILNLYESYESEATLDAIACDIFEMVCAECRYPTMVELLDYYSLKSVATIDWRTATLEQVAELILELLVNPAEKAYFTINFFQLMILNMQSVFNGEYKSGAITRMAALGADNPDDDYAELCDSCNDTYAWRTWDFTQQQYNSYKTGGFSSSGGTYFAGSGWRGDKINATGGRLTVAIPVQSTWKIRAIGYETDVPKTNFSSLAVEFRPIAGSSSGATGLNMSTDTSSNPNVRCRQGLASLTGFMEIAISLTDDPLEEFYLKRVWVVFDKGFAPLEAIPTSDATACERYT